VDQIDLMQKPQRRVCQTKSGSGQQAAIASPKGYVTVTELKK
jgi:hypothetical protein